MELKLIRPTNFDEVEHVWQWIVDNCPPSQVKFQFHLYRGTNRVATNGTAWFTNDPNYTYVLVLESEDRDILQMVKLMWPAK